MPTHSRTESSTTRNRLSDSLLRPFHRGHHNRWSSGRVFRRSEPGGAVYPTFIWARILHFATHPPYIDQGRCEPVHFFDFAIAHRATPSQIDYLRACLHRRWELKHVCKVWRDILESMAQPWIRARIQKQVPSIPVGIRRLDVCASEGPRDDTWLSRTLALLLSFRSPSRRPLDGITTLAIEGTVLTPEDIQMRDVVLNIFDREGNQVRSFIYEGNSAFIGDLFLRGLERSFSRLTSLTICAYWIKGELTLEHVESLALHVDILDLTGWCFPSLKHYCLGGARPGAEWTDKTSQYRFDTSLLPGPSLDLRSLLLYRPYQLEASTLFWQMFPTLEFIGVSQITIDESPPADHPMRYLGWSEGLQGDGRDTYDRISETIDKLPSVAALLTPYIVEDGTFDGTRSYRTFLSQKCQSQNIRWIAGDS